MAAIRWSRRTRTPSSSATERVAAFGSSRSGSSVRVSRESSRVEAARGSVAFGSEGSDGRACTCWGSLCSSCTRGRGPGRRADGAPIGTWPSRTRRRRRAPPTPLSSPSRSSRSARRPLSEFSSTMSALISKLPIPATLVERLQPVLALLPSSVPKPLKWAFFALLISASRLSASSFPAVGLLGELRGQGAQEGGRGGVRAPEA